MNFSFPPIFLLLLAYFVVSLSLLFGGFFLVVAVFSVDVLNFERTARAIEIRLLNSNCVSLVFKDGLLVVVLWFANSTQRCRKL